MTKLSLDQFVDKYNGKSVDYDKQYREQCVDLFNFYNSEVVGAPFIGTPKTNGARDLFEVDSATRRAYYNVVDKSAVVKAGDVLVYGEPFGRAIVAGKTIFYGHVRIAIDGKRAIEQNARIAYKTTIDTFTKTGLLGILRPKIFAIKETPQTDNPPKENKNKHTIVNGDTFWGLEEKYNIPHGTLQKLNPGIDAKSLQIGSTIRLRPEPSTAPGATKTYYTIRRGDTFWGLEDAWQLPHGTLQKLNPGIEPRELSIGQRIRRG